jgi:hypothetical protein
MNVAFSKNSNSVLFKAFLNILADTVIKCGRYETEIIIEYIQAEYDIRLSYNQNELFKDSTVITAQFSDENAFTMFILRWS